MQKPWQCWNRFAKLLSTILFLTLFVSFPSFARPHSTKVDARVYSQLRNSPSTPVWVYLQQKADLSRAEVIKDRAKRRQAVYQRLREVAVESQGSLRAELDRRGVYYKSYWVVNALLVQADSSLVDELVKRGDVKRVMPNPKVHMLHDPLEAKSGIGAARGAASTSGVEWNIQAIHVPEVWAAGYRGQGVVVAGADTGVDWTHSAIQQKYRGYSAVGVQHDYNWHDSISHQGEPYDDHSHGTFTVGEMVGDDGNGNQIGVAPEAKWIACKNMDAGGNGTPESYTECFEWFLAPTDMSGENPNPMLGPDIINNSWSCPDSEGCYAEALHDIAKAVQSAGIMLVFSAGNSGPSCGTVNEPVAMYPEVLSVGATDSMAQIANYSSRGPSAYDRGRKPNVSAPGSGVRSCVPGDAYSSMSGTSMAAPLVVGSVALLWSADKDAIGDIERVSSLLEDTADFRLGPRCGAGLIREFNNTYGYGIIDAKAALDALLSE